MIFRRKKDRSTGTEETPHMRSRGKADSIAGNGPGSGQNPLAQRFRNDDEPDTIELGQGTGFNEFSKGESGEMTTGILAGETADEESSTQQPMENPISGFLVVIRGPGRGSVSTLVYGTNSIGRHSSQCVALDHGDKRISRENHCLVSFDSISGKFYVQPGEGRSLTYLGDDPVLIPTELTGGSHIRIGDTVLRFVPLCGSDFSWEN
jgi:hypothetical protein